MKAKSDLNTKVMYEQACAFLDCAKYTESEKYKIEGRTKSHLYVDMSLSALACEIFIKCLIINKNGDYNNDHTLEKLWHRFKFYDQDTAEQIEGNMKARFHSSDEDMFDKMIHDASNAFVQWRYVFDYEASDCVKINPQFLRFFREELRSLCGQKIQ